MTPKAHCTFPSSTKSTALDDKTSRPSSFGGGGARSAKQSCGRESIVKMVVALVAALRPKVMIEMLHV